MNEYVTVPAVGESIVDGVISVWYKKSGDYVKAGENLLELETAKASVAVPSPFEGRLEIMVKESETVSIGQKIAKIETGIAQSVPVAPTAPVAPSAPAAAAAAAKPLSPAARRIVEEKGIDAGMMKGTGKDGRLTKGDLIASVSSVEAPAADRPIVRKPMSLIRKTIADHLAVARREAAYLTTFNEIDMKKLMEIRALHQTDFTEKHGVKLGIVSFFIKAGIAALMEYPAVNGRIEGDDIVTYGFYDIGVAVSTERGLLVPVIRNADQLSFAEMERKIADLGERARNKKISLPELQGGTFSITNGGIFGSMMSTPIPNHPQPAILGLHAIKDRPVAIDGQIAIRPMMYVALTYDHRLIDGREAVGFLSLIKELIEDPDKLFLGS